MAEPIIQFEGVSKSYGPQTVLRDFSLEVVRGEFLTIIGRSGGVLVTRIAPDSGRALAEK